jgi:hypothetical protein
MKIHVVITLQCIIRVTVSSTTIISITIQRSNLNEKFQPTNLFNHSLVVPGRHHVLHVEVGGEEADDAVRHYRDSLGQQSSVISGIKKYQNKNN